MPVIVAVDEDVDSLADVERELTDRYSRSYEIVTASSVSDGVARLIEMDSSGEDVALVLVGLSLGPSRWSELLQRARALHPRAQRGLIIELDGWGDTETGRLILNAMARREIDYYVFRPAKAPDEVFHQAISNFLLEWGMPARSPRRRFTSSASRGPAAPTSSGRCSAAAPSPTTSSSPIRGTDAPTSGRTTNASCRS